MASTPQLDHLLAQLSPEHLQVLTDCAAYLLEQERHAATQELLDIPGLLEQVRQAQQDPISTYQNWRTLRSDV
ncbi:hypothetical protein PN441_08450 [Spirulina major CS-329]|uniref:hypothetical protein n=1 Tax=Spirulina TaxID=1154 RepID=UPI00232CDB48|nr:MULTISPECIES: hypothetical protein [Spirulina]MDB9494418.1 hypothetical protein [Spirulina subsalsa CS-330]MDB9503102.1 hypothetical protein [Spirulina major CS-329]